MNQDKKRLIIRICVYSAIMLFLFGSYYVYQFVLNPLHEEIYVNEEELKIVQEELEQTQAHIKERVFVGDGENVLQMTDRIPIEMDVQQIVRNVVAQEKDEGIIIHSITFEGNERPSSGNVSAFIDLYESASRVEREEVEQNQYDLLSDLTISSFTFSVRYTSSPEELDQFLTGIRSLPRIVDVDTVEYDETLTDEGVKVEGIVRFTAYFADQLQQFVH